MTTPPKTPQILTDEAARNAFYDMIGRAYETLVESASGGLKAEAVLALPAEVREAMFKLEPDQTWVLTDAGLVAVGLCTHALRKGASLMDRLEACMALRTMSAYLSAFVEAPIEVGLTEEGHLFAGAPCTGECVKLGDFGKPAVELTFPFTVTLEPDVPAPKGVRVHVLASSSDICEFIFDLIREGLCETDFFLDAGVAWDAHFEDSDDVLKLKMKKDDPCQPN